MTTSASSDRQTVAATLCATVRSLGARGFAPATSGNFSAVLERDPTRLLITSSGVDKSELRVDQLMVVDADGRPAEGETLRPSAETLLHTALVARDASIGCVLHTHSVWNTLVGMHFASRGRLLLGGFELQKGLTGVTSHEERIPVPVVANSQDMPDLAHRMIAALDAEPEARGFLIAGHGLYTWGADVATAKRHVDTFEFLFECIGRSTPLSVEPSLAVR